jgi:hypothetical protein
MVSEKLDIQLRESDLLFRRYNVFPALRVFIT